ncbi:MAG: zinc-ribbon domain containing protein [Chloroflexi bacterium]|nr:zinc-ribbon domain containing protein [Chloroflexota bacterium]
MSTSSGGSARDVHLRCACCGESFVYSAGEQELHALRGVVREPRACPGCRRRLGAS